MSSESYFLKHDYNARNDPKMARLLRLCGWAGYGIAWAIIEMLYEQGGSIDHDAEQLAYELRTDEKLIEKVIACEVFYSKAGKIGCRRVDRAFEQRRASINMGREYVGRRLRPDGSPWVKDEKTHEKPTSEHSPLVGSYADPYTRRREEKRREEITTGSAGPKSGQPVDLKRVIDQTAQKLTAEPDATGDDFGDYRLPKNFGRYGGAYVTSMSVDDCKSCLTMRPGPRVLAALKWRIKVKESEAAKPRQKPPDDF